MTDTVELLKSFDRSLALDDQRRCRRSESIELDELFAAVREAINEIERLRALHIETAVRHEVDLIKRDEEIERLREKEATAEIIFETNKKQREEIGRLIAWREEAFEVHPNIDLEIDALRRRAMANQAQASR